MNSGPHRNIRLTVETAEKLKKLGAKGETYEDIILKLIDPPRTDLEEEEG